MSITKPFINKFLSLMLVLSVVLAGLLPSTAVYASEVNTPGSGRSIAELTADGLIMDVTVPTNVLIYVDEHGEVTIPDYLPIINNSVAPVFVHSLTVTPQNGWTLDPTNTDYTNFKVNQKNYWIAFNGLDPSIGPIALATPINGSDSLNLVLSADVAPQKTAINSLNIGEIVITFDWDAAEGAQEPVIPPETGSFTVGEVFHEYEDGYGDFVFIPLLTGGAGDYRVIIVAEGTDPETQALTDEVVYKESEESCTPGVPLPGYNPAQTYEVYVTYEESETIMKVLSAKEVNQDINFEVHSVDHGGEGIVEFCMTVEAPCTVGFAMVPAGSQPPQNGTSSFNLDYAGTQTRGVEIYGGYDDSIDYDIYVWVYDAEWNPVGPVKVLLAAYGSETGDDDSGSGDEDSTGPNGEFIPEGYVLATDSDFYGDADGEFVYIGSDDYVVVPHVIKGVPVTSYFAMFGHWSHKASDVKGVASDNPNITTMERMFGDSRATTLDLSNLDTSNVTNMTAMFGNSRATTLDLSNFDTSKVTDMSVMFHGSEATTLDLSSFNTSNVTNMTAMFENSSATTLDLSSFDTSNVTTMHRMFENSSATTLDLSSFDTSSVTDMSFMFYYSKATTLDLSSFDTSKVTNMAEMFNNSQATTGYARTIEDANRLNASAYKPAGLIFEVKGYVPPEPPEGPEWVLATDSDFYKNVYGDITYKGKAEYVIIPDKINYLPVTSYQNMFKGTAVKGVKSTNPNVTNMSGMFEDSTAESLDLSELNTSGVTNMANMFKNSLATTIDVSNFDTTNVTTMKGMFEGSHATTLDLSNFDTTNVTTMVDMFRGSHATTLDLSGFDLSNISTWEMEDMFTLAKATTGYARTTADATKLNNISGKPMALNFVVK